jgi:hypothetical protein
MQVLALILTAGSGRLTGRVDVAMFAALNSGESQCRPRRTPS